MSNGVQRPGNGPLYVLPLFGRPRLLRGEEEVRLGRKGLALLYYLALEGPTPRARLADLLYGHRAALQNLRVELHRLSRVLGQEVFPKRQDPLHLPPWIRLESQGQGEVLEGLEEVGQLWEWVMEVRLRHEPPPPTLGREPLLAELAALSPPFLLVLRGRLGAGQRALAQALARHLRLPLYETPRAGGLVFLEPPYPPVAVPELLRTRALVVLSLDPGEEPRLFLELRARYPVERTRVLELPPLTWGEARAGPLAGLPFPQAARAYFLAGGQPEWIPEWLACQDTPRRPLARLRLQARLLSEPARLALERLSVAPGVIPEEVLDALGAAPYLEELERKGWLVYQGGHRFAKEAERRFFYAALTPGRRRELHERAATALALSGRHREEALHRMALGEGYLGLLDPPLRQALLSEGWARRSLGLGRELALLPQGSEGLTPQGEGFALALLEPGQEAYLGLAPFEEAVVLELLGEAFAPEDSFGLLLALRGAGGEGVLRLQGSFHHRILLPPGPFRLRFFGLGVAEFRLRAYRPLPGGQAPGRQRVEAWVLAAEEVRQQAEDQGKEEGRGDWDVYL